jgi:hypothetical protein
MVTDRSPEGGKDRDQVAAGPEHPLALAKHLADVLHVLECVLGENDVEAGARERQGLGETHAERRVRAAAPREGFRQPGESFVDIDAVNGAAAVALQPFHGLAPDVTSNVEHHRVPEATLQAEITEILLLQRMGFLETVQLHRPLEPERVCSDWGRAKKVGWSKSSLNVAPASASYAIDRSPSRISPRMSAYLGPPFRLGRAAELNSIATRASGIMSPSKRITDRGVRGRRAGLGGKPWANDPMTHAQGYETPDEHAKKITGGEAAGGSQTGSVPRHFCYILSPNSLQGQISFGGFEQTAGRDGLLHRGPAPAPEGLLMSATIERRGAASSASTSPFAEVTCRPSTAWGRRGPHERPRVSFGSLCLGTRGAGQCSAAASMISASFAN